MQIHFYRNGKQPKVSVWPTDKRDDAWAFCLGDQRSEFLAEAVAQALLFLYGE